MFNLQQRFAFRDQPGCGGTAELQMDADYRLPLSRGFEPKGHFLYLFFTSQNSATMIELKTRIINL